jgi:tetratricopeptide (TPR) repeat protein
MNPFSFLSKRARASRANERGRALASVGRAQEAIAEYERAHRLAPDWSMPAFNLGLQYKYAGDWTRALEYNQRATELDPEDQGGWWNLGIAATALGRWDVARSAWQAAGLRVPDGDGPPDFPCGRTPIRLNPDADGEVVWSDRLDPARARIVSIPLAESGFRFADIVLHDGATKGHRRLGNRDVPVFDCLQLLTPSSFSTWVAEVEPHAAPATPDWSWSDLLEDLAAERGLAAEDWTRSVARICKECSEGRPHAAHERENSGAGPHRVAIAAHDTEQVHSLLDEWRRRTDAARVLTVDVVLSAGGLT